MSVDSTKEEILEAIRELSERFVKLEDVVNHPKSGIGAKMVGLTLRTDTIYSDIHGVVDGILVNMAKVKGDLADYKAKADHVEQAQDRFAKIIAENKKLKADLIMAQGLLQKYSQKIEAMDKKILDLTKRGMEQNLVFHAVEEVANPKNESCYETLICFVKEFLEVEIDQEDIWKAYRMGVKRENRARAIFAKLSYAAKELIMDKVSLLKDKRNIHGQVRFIAEQIPDGITEAKKRISKRASILRTAEEKKPMAERRDIKILGDKIVVGGELDKAEVITPQPFELFPGIEEQKRINNINRKIKEAEPRFEKKQYFRRSCSGCLQYRRNKLSLQGSNPMISIYGPCYDGIPS